MTTQTTTERQKALQDVLREIRGVWKYADESASNHNFKVGVDVVRRRVEDLLEKSVTKDCPHATPFRYCPECVADPCPIGLGRKQ